MREKLSIAALALSGLACLVVLLSPTPKDPKKGEGGPAQRVWRRVRAEENALHEDRLELDRIAKRAGDLRENPERARSEEAEVAKLIGDMVGGEVKSRWGDFGKRLETLRLYEKTRPIDPKTLAGVVIDDANARTVRLTGQWAPSRRHRPYVGVGYRHDDGAKDGKSRARFSARLPRAGRYEVRFFYSPFESRATNVPVKVYHAGGVKTITVNQRRAPPGGKPAFLLGTFSFAGDKDARVDITNTGTDGSVAVDAVQFVPAAMPQK